MLAFRGHEALESSEPSPITWRSQPQKLYHYKDFNSGVVNESPPVKDTFYTVLNAEDVRLYWMAAIQTNDENAAKELHVLWTVDGNEYGNKSNWNDNTTYYVNRGFATGTSLGGLMKATGAHNAGYTTDKYGQSFKIEIALTGVAGTNQTLKAYATYERLLVT